MAKKQTEAKRTKNILPKEQKRTREIEKNTKKIRFIFTVNAKCIMMPEFESIHTLIIHNLDTYFHTINNRISYSVYFGRLIVIDTSAPYKTHAVNLELQKR